MTKRGFMIAALAVLALAGCAGSSAPAPGDTVESAETPSGLSESIFRADVGFTVAATKTAESSNDASGATVTYAASNIADDDPATAWRKSTNDWTSDDYILISFDQPIALTEVGLIPGYAKIDPESGTDRFVQNHRLASVVWYFSDGSTWQQEFEDEPTMQSIPVSGTVTWVRLGDVVQRQDEEPAATRDYLAISDVSLVGAAAQ